MAYCPSCGTQAEGRFCPKCGSPIGEPGGAGPAFTAPAATIQASGLADNVAAALCYLFGLITGILFLVLEPYNKNKTIRFHAFQAIFFNLALIVVDFALVVVGVILSRIPFLGFILVLIWPLFGLGCLAVWLFLMYKAYNNEKFKLPIIGDLAEKQA